MRGHRGEGSRKLIRDQGRQDLGAESRVNLGRDGITSVGCEN